MEIINTKGDSNGLGLIAETFLASEVESGGTFTAAIDTSIATAGDVTVKPANKLEI